MQPFTVLTGVAAPLKMVNVDTDMIIPKQFMKTIKRMGLGKSLFYEMRYDPQTGKEGADLLLYLAGSPPSSANPGMKTRIFAPATPPSRAGPPTPRSTT